MIANLLNCALEASSSIDEHGIAFMMLTLATTFHRVRDENDLLRKEKKRGFVVEIKRRSDTIHLHGDPTACCVDEHAVLGDVLLFGCSTSNTQSLSVARRFDVVSNQRSVDRNRFLVHFVVRHRHSTIIGGTEWQRKSSREDRLGNRC